MQFHEYSSIELAGRARDFIGRDPTLSGPEVEWLAVEKVHGANMSIYTDGSSFQLARRTAMLKPEEHKSFNNVTWMEAELKDKMLCAFKLVKAMHPRAADITSIAVYGELAGGEYPHPDVPRAAHANRIQKGVYYTPHNVFLAFDIRPYVGAGSPCEPEEREEKSPEPETEHSSPASGWLPFLDHDDVVSICKTAGLHVLPALHRGTFAEMVALDPSFQTTVPAMFGLPALEDNIAEGYVLRPVKGRSFGKNHMRLMLKHKSPRFQEVAKAPNPHKAARKAEEGHKEPQVDEALQVIADTYITENRLAAVKSKELNTVDLNQLIRLLTVDAMTDIEKDTPDMVADAARRRNLQRLVGRAAADLLKSQPVSY